MSFPRRSFVQAGLGFLGIAAIARTLVGQSRREGIHPPEPSGHELDMILSRDSRTSCPAMNPHQRDAEFRSCLEQLMTYGLKLREQISGSPLSQVLSVQVYRNTQAMERLVKRLKSLAKS